MWKVENGKKKCCNAKQNNMRGRPTVSLVRKKEWIQQDKYLRNNQWNFIFIYTFYELYKMFLSDYCTPKYLVHNSHHLRSWQSQVMEIEISNLWRDPRLMEVSLSRKSINENLPFWFPIFLSLFSSVIPFLGKLWGKEGQKQDEEQVSPWIY